MIDSSETCTLLVNGVEVQSPCAIERYCSYYLFCFFVFQVDPKPAAPINKVS